MRLLFKELYGELTNIQQELTRSLLLLDETNISIDNNEKRCIIDVTELNKKKCFFSLIIHKNDNRISFYIDKDIMVYSFENYLNDKDFRTWLAQSIEIFLYSDIIVIDLLSNKKIKKKELYISEYKDKESFDYPLTFRDGLIWFWKKNRIQSDKRTYCKWLTTSNSG